MEGTKFSEKIIINCSPVVAFPKATTHRIIKNRLKWDTFLKRAELTEGATKADKGVQAYCVAKNGLGMVTEYVSFNRPRATAIKMTRGSFYVQVLCWLMDVQKKLELTNRSHLFIFIPTSFSVQLSDRAYKMQFAIECAQAA